jgi:hypothetical protein
MFFSSSTKPLKHIRKQPLFDPLRTAFRSISVVSHLQCFPKTNPSLQQLYANNRYFILEEGRLAFFIDEECTNLRGEIMLMNCSIVIDPARFDAKQIYLKVSP